MGGVGEQFGMASSLKNRRTLCPHCSVPLAPATNGTISLGVCWKCRGVWLQKDSFAQISRGENHGTNLLGLAKRQEKRELMSRTIRCPVCLYRMAPMNFANCSS